MNGKSIHRHSAVTRGVDVPRPPNQPQRIVVCGGGIVGLTTCYYLARHGHEVVCIEKDAQVGSSHTFHDATLYSSWADISLLYQKQMNTEKKQDKAFQITTAAWFDPAFWAWGLKYMTNATARKAKENARKSRELCNYSEHVLMELLRRHPDLENEMDRIAQGTLELFENDMEKNDAWESDRIKQCIHEFQYPLHNINSNDVADLDPSIQSTAYTGGAIFSPLGTNGNVQRTCFALEKLCKQQGVMFRLKTHIEDILVVEKRVVAIQTTTNELIEGDCFVLALGNDTTSIAKLAGIKLYMYPVKGYVLTIPRDLSYPPLQYNIYSNNKIIISPTLNGHINISGGADFSGSNLKNDPKRIKWLLSQAKKIFPNGYLNENQFESNVNLRPVSADDVPFIGQTILSNMYINTGHGSKGWRQSFGAASILADDISGKIPGINIEQFSPHRFKII